MFFSYFWSGLFTGAVARVKECLVGLTWDLLEMLAYPIMGMVWDILSGMTSPPI